MNIIIIFLTLIFISLVFFLTLISYGLKKYKITDWKNPSPKGLSDWEYIFSKSKNMKVKSFSMGISKTKPGARPYLNMETLPEDYNIKTEDTPPTLCFSVNHPGKGCILIDAGLNSSYSRKNAGDMPLLMKIYQKLSRYEYEVTETENIGHYLSQHNLNPAYVLITHMHPDHVSGLKDITENAVVLFGKKENNFYYKMICGKYMKSQKELKTLDFSKAHTVAPFSKLIDIFGDQSILAISSPGHTVDHISYFINDSEDPILILGDLTISDDFLKRGIESSVDTRDSGHKQLKNSLKELKDFIKSFPHVKVRYSHSAGITGGQ